MYKAADLLQRQRSSGHVKQEEATGRLSGMLSCDETRPPENTTECPGDVARFAFHPRARAFTTSWHIIRVGNTNVVHSAAEPARNTRCVLMDHAVHRALVFSIETP
jgi:hypothetical protein